MQLYLLHMLMANTLEAQLCIKSSKRLILAQNMQIWSRYAHCASCAQTVTQKDVLEQFVDGHYERRTILVKRNGNVCQGRHVYDFDKSIPL